MKSADFNMAKSYGIASITSTNMTQRVHQAIKTFPNGCIQDDLISYFGSDIPYASLTSRVSELARTGKIHRTGEKRKGTTQRRQFVVKDGPAAMEKNDE